jgi:hypothetical protein
MELSSKVVKLLLTLMQNFQVLSLDTYWGKFKSNLSQLTWEYSYCSEKSSKNTEVQKVSLKLSFIRKSIFSLLDSVKNAFLVAFWQFYQESTFLKENRSDDHLRKRFLKTSSWLASLRGQR